MDLLFAYGTLRRGARAPGAPQAVLDALAEAHLSGGRARGRLHRMGEYPVMIRSSAESDVVVGDVYRIDPALWPMLDSYEGDAYVRAMIAVTLDDGTTVRAFAYFGRDPTGLGACIASGDFLA